MLVFSQATVYKVSSHYRHGLAKSLNGTSLLREKDCSHDSGDVIFDSALENIVYEKCV